MNTVTSADEGVNRGALQATVRKTLNATALQLSVLQRRIGTRLGLKDADLECLNLLHAEGPLTPSALARRAGVHPATMTGVIDRLERGGWVARERDPQDRRAVHITPLRDRNRELYDLLAGMNSSMGEILSGLTADELRVVADFLTRTVAAGRAATDDLAEGPHPDR